jgi:predicted RNA-binding protein YlxR (DUF448 family)
LLRLVRTVNRAVVVDPSGRLAGRGAYVCRNGACLQLALDRGALSRALETPVPAEIRGALLTDAATAIPISQGGARGQE